jgi:hypothetical protein
MDMLKRQLVSRKNQTAAAGLLGGILVVAFEVDYTEQILSFITILTTVLVGGQAAIDTMHGSPSDGTLKK